MCLALPALVVALQAPDEAVVELGGVRKTVNLALVPEAREGDYVIVHVGHAIGLVDPDEAAATLKLFAEMEAATAAAAAAVGAAADAAAKGPAA